MFSFSISSKNSSIIKLNNNGDKGQPCLTPALILSSWSLCLLLLFSFQHLYASPLLFLSTDLESPFFLSPFQCCYEIECESNALAKSRNTILSSFRFFVCCLITCCSIFTFSKQPSSGTKPFCLSSYQIFHLSLLSHNLAYNHMNMFPTVIGHQFPT